MIKVNLTNIPQKIRMEISYLLYYTVHAYIITLIILPFIGKFGDVKMTDYQWFMASFVIALFIGYLTLWFKIVTGGSPEYKRIKRNVFIAGFIKILKNNKDISFESMYKNYSFILFQNRKALLHDKDWTTYIETLITLDIIELTNREKLREKNKEFDFKFLKEKIDKATFELKNKRVNIDELIQKLDNYVMD